jgi:capsular polysaccharide transport system permease protein
MPYEGEQAVTAPIAAPRPRTVDWRAKAREVEARYRWPLRLIVAPTLIAALYLGLLAASQYVSEASFLVRNPQKPAQVSMLGQMLGGASMPPTTEAAGVKEFLESHDAAVELQKRLNIVEMYRHSGIDLFARIKAKPTDEDLTKYYRRHVKVTLDPLTGITKLKVRAFSPEDSRRIAETLLTMSEELVNRFSEREQRDAMRVSTAEVMRAQQRLIEVGGQLTQSRQSLDPSSTSIMLMQVMGGLEGQLAKARADFAAASAYLKPGSPRLEELRARVSALQGQVAGQRARLTGRVGALAPTVPGYDRLMIEREFASRDYAAAMTAHEAARVDALKQHLYLVRVVEPNLAQKSLYPQRLLTIFTIFAGLLVAYGLGWLILTGTREHAM